MADVDDLKTHVERASDRELVLRRVFRARPTTVFDAMTNADYIKRWYAPVSLGAIVHSIESDVRVGGQYRYVFGKIGEPPVAFSGTYREVVRAERLVYTQIFEPMPHTGDGVITATYEPYGDGGTLLVQRELYPSKEVLEGALASGMEKGMRETLDQLAAMVVELQALQA